jgi:hypothetical protein
MSAGSVRSPQSRDAVLDSSPPFTLATPGVSAALLPTDRLQYRRQLLETLVKDGKWMSIDERGLVSIDRRLPVLELDMARPQTGVVSVPVNPDRKIPRRFYPVNAIVFVLDTGGVPEAEIQSRALDVVRCP